MKRHLAYKVSPNKVNLILVSDSRNETSSLKFNLNAFGINYEKIGLSSSLRVLKCLKNTNKLLRYFRDSLYSLYGKSCFPMLQFIE